MGTMPATQSLVTDDVVLPITDQIHADDDDDTPKDNPKDGDDWEDLATGDDDNPGGEDGKPDPPKK